MPYDFPAPSKPSDFKYWRNLIMKSLTELIAMAQELCYAIEKLPPSEQQTAIILKASAVNQRLQDLLRTPEQREVFEQPPKGKDQPLKVDLSDERLVISIGVDTLAHADKERTGYVVSNPTGFAEEVSRQLLKDNEIGATLLTDLFDDAMECAINDGSVHAKYDRRAIRQ